MNLISYNLIYILNYKQLLQLVFPGASCSRGCCTVGYLTSSEGPEEGSSGTGDVASMRAGFRMIGKDMGGTPTCRGEARGCRMRGGWLKAEEAWAGDVRGTEVCPADD